MVTPSIMTAIIAKIIRFIIDKELLYVQDALGHEQYFQTQCREAANQLQDAELRSFAQQLEQQHKNVFQNLYNLL